MEVHSKKARWERALDLFCAAVDIEKQLKQSQPPLASELTERLVEPYVNRWPGTGVWFADRHNLYSHEIEKSLQSGKITKELTATLKELAGNLIGQEYKIIEMDTAAQADGLSTAISCGGKNN